MVRRSQNSFQFYSKYATNSPDLTEILFHKKFGIPWIFCWSFSIMQYYPPPASFSLVREYKIKWWEKFTVNKFCSLDVVQAKLLHTTQSMIPAIPSTPQKKQERSSKDKGKATSSNELDELQSLKKENQITQKTKTIVIIQSYPIGFTLILRSFRLWSMGWSLCWRSLWLLSRFSTPSRCSKKNTKYKNRKSRQEPTKVTAFGKSKGHYFFTKFLFCRISFNSMMIHTSIQVHPRDQSSLITQAIYLAKFNSLNDSKSTNDAKLKDQRTINSLSSLHTKEEWFNKNG